jgi:epidermal growth factor receptor substrate 15
MGIQIQNSIKTKDIIQNENIDLKKQSQSLLNEKEELINQNKNLSTQFQNLVQGNDLVQNELINLKKDNNSIIREKEKIKNQLKSKKQLNNILQNEIQEKQFSFQILTNQIEHLINQCHYLNLEKEQNQINFEQQLLEYPKKFQKLETFQQVNTPPNFLDLLDKIESGYNQYQIKLEEYLSAPPSSDSHQEEADRLRFLFLSHFSNLHQTQSIRDYFQSILDDENDFEQFFEE